MSKTVFIQASTLGRDINSVDLYHTSISSGSKIATAVSSSAIRSGSSYQVPDTAVTFLAVCNDGGECQLSSGSITISAYNRNIRYFNIHNTYGSATVEITYPVAAGPSTGSITQSVDFREYSYITIQADPSPEYPNITTFDGWYDASSSGNLIATNNPLSITQTAYTGSKGDEFYAIFS